MEVGGHEEVTLPMRGAAKDTFFCICQFQHFLTDELLLSAPQPTFEHDGWTVSNCSLLHKLLITGQEEQVVSRRGELNRDLLSSTCEYKHSSGTTVSKVRCRIGLKCRLEIKFLTHTGAK